VGPVGKGASGEIKVEETGLEESGRSGAHRRGYPGRRSSSGEERW
jgi:hypothetical protein